jgi:hypothetical protein
MRIFSFFFLHSLFFLSFPNEITKNEITKNEIIEQEQINVCVWLSGASYCSKDEYSTMNIGGPASGFVYKDTLHDLKTDLQGYIGILENTQSIYVVLRGSSSIMNWLDDFEVKLVPYTTFPECNCNVHYGFYRSALGISNKTISNIETLMKQYPSYSVIVTGHSYGASCALLLAMELERNGIHTKVYNYGQPRVGDTNYAKFVNTILPVYYRLTHNKDIVPHVPPIKGFGYLHSCGEIFEDSNGKLTLCNVFDNTTTESNLLCEDPLCADQYTLSQTNIQDHSSYLQHFMGCQGSLI